VNFTEF